MSRVSDDSFRRKIFKKAENDEVHESKEIKQKPFEKMQKKPLLRPLSLFIGEGGRQTHLMCHQNEMRRMDIGRCESPTRLKHTQASLPSAFNALIVFHKPFKSQHSTFETTIFSPDWNSTKTLVGGKGGIVSTMISRIHYSMGPRPAGPMW